MRPHTTRTDADRYECFDCGRRVAATDRTTCPDCGGELERLGRSRDL